MLSAGSASPQRLRTMSHAEGPSLTDLPAELLYEVSEHLSIMAHAYLAATCRILQAALVPELYKRDRKTGTYRTLSWAACTRKSQAVATIERARSYWPPGNHHLQVYFRTSKAHHGKSLRYLTPLMAAIQAGNHLVVCYLLDNGVNIHQCEQSPAHRDTLWYPIHHAVMMDHFTRPANHYPTKHKLDVIHLLISNGANPNQLSSPNPGRKSSPNSRGRVTPMHLAIKNGADNHVIDMLIDSGAAATRVPYCGVPDQHFSNITPISHLLNAYDEPTEGHCLAVQNIAANGGGAGSEAQMYTVSGHPLLIDFLSKPRASPFTAKMVKEILEGAWVRFEDTTQDGDGAILHLLKSHMNWKPPKPYDKRLILHHEEQNDMIRIATTTCDTIDVLLQHHADIEERDASGRTPIHVAAGLHRHYSGILDHLVTCGANVRARSSDGCTALHALVMGDPGADHTLITHLIKHHKIDRFARDENGNTFLHKLVTCHVTPYHKWIFEASKHYSRQHWSKYRNNAGESPMDVVRKSALPREEWDAGQVVRSAREAWIDEAYKDKREYKDKKTCGGHSS
ncbi:ankyrin repeat-containing domain protein [Truncatella angustata]|uniref:Ankyrin repeat-containing domain protein n=1 Tax=Truncatella angustata TaxID=152316 RepID=A0A9P8RFW1_9PEZI|nr:ankyrin repeat-containing domain protein [Truncatella angustata]KAH6645258.1 ankyrin repeat-containing domain protein [Truncatella angustata]KAH8200589.1 hypothetical protein TruAng_005241 [Truncatella angustata]